MGPILTTSLFGNKSYSEIFSNVSLGLAIASIVSLPVYGYIFEFTGSYTGALITILVMLIIAIVCILVAYKSKDKMVQDGLWD